MLMPPFVLVPHSIKEACAIAAQLIDRRQGF